MKGISITLALATTPAFAQWGTGSNANSHATRGFTGNGTYVPPHQQTNPNGTQYDTTAPGELQPYTGQMAVSPRWTEALEPNSMLLLTV